MTKQQLRKEIAEKRRGLTADWIRHNSRAITNALQAMDIFDRADTIALYKAISGEVDLETLFPQCWAAGQRTCIPVFNPSSNGYEMAEIDANTHFNTGNYGISEPVSSERVPLDAIGLMVVPGVAFDSRGNRLGRGGGYYDRLLAGFSGKSAAVAFDFQLFPQIPCDSHDVPVDFIVTATKTIKVQNEH